MTEEVKPSETGEESATKEENTSEKPEQTIEEKLEEVKITEDKKEKDENDNKEDPQVKNTQIEKEHNKEENGDEDEEGQELDDDEIEENPAYIPKKGRYYMHDSRDAEAPEDLELKKSRADGSWSHDRYVERWQQPKSKRQLVARYGFDIRHNETEQEGEEDERAVPSESPPRNGERPAEQRGRGRGGRGGRIFREQGVRGSHEDREGSGEDEREDQGDEIRERGGSRRQRPSKPGVVRNVRGGRGQSSTMGSRPYRNQERPRNGTGERQEREEYREEAHEQPPRRDKEEHMENHRRGVIRGAVRGFNSQPRQFVRTVSSSNRGDRGGRYPEPRREQQNGRDMPTGRWGPGSEEENLSERRLSGGYTNRGRGVRGTTRGFPRGGGDIFRGGAPPKRYPMRHEGPPLPPPQPMGPPRGYAPRQEVVFFDHPAPPPSAHQASPVVYFDPAVQQPNRPLPPREKKIIEIKSPN